MLLSIHGFPLCATLVWHSKESDRFCATNDAFRAVDSALGDCCFVVIFNPLVWDIACTMAHGAVWPLTIENLHATRSNANRITRENDFSR